MSKTYSDKLKSPKWQKKRLEIMERDGFQCQCCFDREETLTVHHKEYIKGREPWDYDNKYLITLCEDCHESVHLWEGKYLKNPESIKFWVYDSNITDWRIMHKRFEMLNQLEGDNAIKTVVQLLTAYVISEKDI